MARADSRPPGLASRSGGLVRDRRPGRGAIQQRRVDVDRIEVERAAAVAAAQHAGLARHLLLAAVLLEPAIQDLAHLGAA